METIKCEITKKDLKILYTKLCVYKNGDKKGEIPANCYECILREIEWVAVMATADKKAIVRDLCFAICHDGILTENPKHIHH